MKISVFGLGYVGAVTSSCLARFGNDVVGVDVDRRKSDMIKNGESPIFEDGLGDLISQVTQAGNLKIAANYNEAIKCSDLSLICVGTPSAADGGVDTSQIERVARQIGQAIKLKGQFHSIVVRSTVMPGTTIGLLQPIIEKETKSKMGEVFRLSMHPEFLREGRSIRDFYDPPFTIIGSHSVEEFQKICSLYKCIPGEKIHCSIETAESLKYFCNLFHATKITFANEVGSICQNFGVDSREAMNILCRDTKLNVSSSYLKPGFAFGGSCLPKDLRACIQKGHLLGNKLPMLNGILKSNQYQIEQVAQRIMNHGQRKIGMLGLSFKEGTDDLRESSLVTLAEILFGKGYDLAIYDLNVQYASLHGANKRFIDDKLPHLKRILVSLDAVLAHGNLLVVGHRGKVYEEALKRVGEGQFVVDLVGLENQDRFLGNYEGIYW